MSHLSPDFLAHAGEVPVAYVQLREGATVDENELLAFATRSIGERAAVPKAVHVVAQIPVTAVGKIFKPALLIRRSRTSCGAKPPLAESR